MQKYLVAAPIFLLAASPASATGGMVCTTAGDRPIALSLTIGHAAVSTVVAARLSEAGRPVPVSIAQSWIDRSGVRIDLTDPQALRHELRLNVRAAGDHYDGSLWRKGQRHWVRCREG